MDPPALPEQCLTCTNCRKAYINNEENIKENFGYNRLGLRYKTCIICRNKRAEKRPVRVILSENSTDRMFTIKYRVEGNNEKMRVRYSDFTRDEVYKKMFNGLEEMEDRYTNIVVVVKTSDNAR